MAADYAVMVCTKATCSYVLILLSHFSSGYPGKHVVIKKMVYNNSSYIPWNVFLVYPVCSFLTILL